MWLGSYTIVTVITIIVAIAVSLVQLLNKQYSLYAVMRESIGRLSQWSRSVESGLESKER